MSEMGEYWNDVKSHFKNKKEIYQSKIHDSYDFLRKHKDCEEVGDHHRIFGEWDFWWTGTVRNIKTGEQITYKKLIEKLQNND